MSGILEKFAGGLATAQAAQQGQMVQQQQVQAMDKQNKLAELLGTPGTMQGLMTGDANALAAYAQATGDPMAAMKIQQQALTTQGAGLQNDARRQNMDLQRKEFDMAVQQQAAQMTAQERQAAAQRTRQAVQAGMTAQTPEQWDALANQMGQPDLVGKFDMREGILSTYLSAAETFERFDEQNAAPEAYKPMSGPGKVQSDINAGVLPSDTPLRSSAPSKTVYGADGQVLYQEGSAAPKMTVDGAKNSGFYLRTKEANDILNAQEGQGLRWGQQQLDSVPMGLGNFGRDPEFQQFDQARRDFVNAILRRESGAVIADSEFENANKQYFPQPGDSAEVIAQKRRNRETAIEGVRIGAGEGASYVDQTQQPAPPEVSQGAIPQTFIEGVGSPELAQPVWDALTPEEKALFQ